MGEVAVLYYLSMIIIIVSSVSYQFLQKKIPENINPAITLIVTYAVALIGSCFLFFIFPFKKGLTVSFGEVNLTSYLLGISIIGIELGYLLIYRFGGKVSLAYTLVSAAIIVILALGGIFLFHENLSSIKYFGLLLCIIGVVLLTL